MAENITLRLARRDDAARIVSVIQRAFVQYDGVLVPPSGAMSETADSVAARLADESCVLAISGTILVGCVFYKEFGGHLYFSRLAVLPDRRGGGIARRLIAAVEAAAHDRGIAAVTLGVRIALPENLAFFTMLGYREIARETHQEFTAPTSITMAKRLGP
jgi:predicted N-acetyltransferase YhbS